MSVSVQLAPSDKPTFKTVFPDELSKGTSTVNIIELNRSEIPKRIKSINGEMVLLRDKLVKLERERDLLLKISELISE